MTSDAAATSGPGRRGLRLRYALWVALMPVAVFALVFAGLCAYECTAAPWVTFIAAPFIALALGVGAFIVYLRKASLLGGAGGAALRRFVLWSLLWGPVLAVGAFYAAVALLSVV